MIVLHEEVRAALEADKPVVALESAVVTAGLPREPLPLPQGLRIDGWRAEEPANLELGRAMERAVRDAGAVPATVAVLDGRLCIGLSDRQLQDLALDARAGKAAITDLAHALAQSHVTAGTTVSATLAAIHAARSSASGAASSALRVLATGGIGGIHREWHKRPDVSADLRALAGTAVCIVCSGGKSILDLPATLEALEALNVPVLGYRTHLFPQFISPGTSDLRLRLKVEDAAEVASICRTHWSALQMSGGVMLANPVPEAFAVDAVEMTLAIEAAERTAKQRGVIGALRTPFLLMEIARLTENRSLAANLALLVNNALLAAAVARAMAEATTQRG